MPTPPKTTRRKKPICRQCGFRMAGHTRVEGSPICPQKSALASPPASPTPTRASALVGQTPLIGPFVEFNFQPDSAFYTKMECGTLRRVNPNFVDKKVPIPELASPARSLAPTVLVDDDGNTIRGSNDGSTIRVLNYGGPATDDEEDEDGEDEDEDEEDEDEDDEEYYHQSMLDIRQPMLTIFRTKDKDLPHMQETAIRMGVHYGVLTPPTTPPKDTKGVPSTPPTQKSTRNTTQSSPARENPMWFVMGQEAGFVQEVIDSCQRGMPGTIAKDSELMEPFRATSFLQLVVAGVVGGCVVVCGLSLL